MKSKAINKFSLGKIMLTLLITSISFYVHAQTYMIKTYAGGGIGDGDSAIKAPLNKPRACAVDASGNLYIADDYHQVIRKVNTNGIISTVAGNGMNGYSGDGGQATAAKLSSPKDVAIDAAGNIYVADYGNNRIRKIKPNGVITTVAGTGTAGFAGDGAAANLAQLKSPWGVTVDITGNIYIADYQNSRIRKINTSGVISTIAGNGTFSFSGDGGLATAAALASPTSVATDLKGNVYIADQSNNRIRTINSNGIISTVGGNGTGSFLGDGGAATSAEVYTPERVAVDKLGNIYVADTRNNRVRIINTNGDISTIAGSASSGYSGDGYPAVAAQIYWPTGIAVDTSGNVYITENGNNVIRKIDLYGIISTYAGNGFSAYCGNGSAAINAELYNPFAVATNKKGEVYIADYYNHLIRKVSTNGIITTVAGNGYIAPSGGSGGYSGDGGPATNAALNYPMGVAVDTSGNIYIDDTNNSRIRKVNSNGIITTIAGNGTGGDSGDGGPATAAEFNNVQGMAIDAIGNIYLAEMSSIRKIDVNGIITTFAGTGMPGNNTGDGGPATAATFNSNGVGTDILGNVYIADGSYHVIRKVNTLGIISTVAGNGYRGSMGEGGFSGDGGPATAAELNSPVGITADIFGNLYIAEQANNRIRKVNTNGIINTIAGNGTGGFLGDGGSATAAELYNPSGITVDALGNIYVADMQNQRIRQISACTTPTLSFSGTASVCQGFSTNITVSGATTYTWSSNAGSATTNTVVLAPTLNTTYTVTGANGLCLSTKTINIAVNALPTFTASSTTICNGIEAIIPFTASILSTYTWVANNNPNTTGESLTTQTKDTIRNTITNSSNSIQVVNYSITATASVSGCTSSQNVSVTVIPTITLSSVNTESLCSNSSSNISFASNIPSTYTWLATNNPNTSGESITTQTTSTLNNTILDNAASIQLVTYTVTPTSIAGNCTGVSQTITLTIYPLPVVSFIGLAANYGTASPIQTLTPTPTGGTFSGFGINVNTFNPSVAGVGTHTITYTYTDGNGCTNSLSHVTTVSAAPPTPDICLVTTDSTSNYNYNIVFWDKSLYTTADSFIVYRNCGGTYLRLAALPKDSSRLVDTYVNVCGPNGGDPSVTSYQYKLAIVDASGIYSAQSLDHRTTNVYVNGSNINWNDYAINGIIAATGYDVYRDSLATGNFYRYAQGLTSTQINIPSFSIYPNQIFRVDPLGFNCNLNQRYANGNNSPFTVRQKSHSNTARQAGQTTDINSITSNKYQISVYPNPSNSTLNLVISQFDNSKTNSVEIYNAIGECIHRQIITSPNCQINIADVSNGLYQLRVVKNNTLVYQTKISKVD